MKFLFFLLLSLTSIHILEAQVTKSSYDSAVDYLNCKAVGLSLKNHANGQEFNQRCPCGVTNYNSIAAFLKLKNGLSSTDKLAKDIDDLKNKYKSNWTREEVLSFLSSDIFTDSVTYSSLFAFANKRRDDGFETFKASIRNELSEKINPAAAIVNIPQPDNNSHVDTYESNEEEVVKPTSHGVTWQVILICIIISLIVSGAALYLALKMSLEKAKRMDRKIKSELNNLGHLVRTLPMDKEKNRNAYTDDIFKRINDLEILANRLKEEREPALVAPVAQKTVIAKEVPQDTEVKKEHFFLSTPNANGSFNDSSASAVYKEGASIYKFTKEAFNRATFCIDERDASVKMALQYPDKNIDPVCEASNAYNPKATRIITREMGVAELKGDKWVLNTKAKISYEG